MRPLCLICLLLLTALCPTVAQAKLAVGSAILMNANTGRILYEQRADAAIPPASLTKILTMYIAMDQVKAKRLKLTSLTRISRAAATTGGSRMHLRTGEKVSLQKLLTGMAVASGNDASVAVAQRVSASSRSFVKLMNRKAKLIGMRSSVFKTPNGLPAKGQITTARDMLTMAKSYMATHPQAMRFHNTHALSHNGFTMYNTNALLAVRGVDGLKTGWIAASGYNLIFTAKRGKTRLIGVVLGGKTRAIRDNEARRLLEAGFTAPSAPKAVAKRLARR